jgi:hypothetical protein
MSSEWPSAFGATLSAANAFGFPGPPLSTQPAQHSAVTAFGFPGPPLSTQPSQPVEVAVGAAFAPDPLGLVTRYLESGSSSKACFINTPLAEFDLHQYHFIPFSTRSARFPVVSLSILRCECATLELRLTIIRHVLREMIRLQKWSALMVYRLNGEMSPALDALYQQAAQELDKLQPQIRPITHDPKHKSMQVVLIRSC